MDLELGGKRALVTGSSAGIGEAIAKCLAAEGAQVAVHGRRREPIDRVVNEIRSDGGRAEPALGDLSTDQGAGEAADQALKALGGVDILINNAGAYPNSTWSDASAQQWLETYGANVGSAVRLISRLVPGMRERGWGRVIQIATGEATNPFAAMPDYAASKAAMVNLTVSLAKELDRSGVTANTVSPGIIVTPGVESFFREVAAKRGWGDQWEDIEAAVIRDWLPNFTGRLGRVEDVAYVATLIASPRSGYVNGANIRVDGGSTAVIN